MTSVIRSIAGIVVFAAIDAAPLAAQTSAPLAADSVRRALADYAQRAEALGVSGVLLVAAGDDVMLHRALGWRDPARHVPNDTATLFYIASMVKQFIATAVLTLEDDGRVRTSDSLPSFFENVPPDKRAITLDQLLSHTSGLGLYGWDPVRRDWLVQDRDQVVRGILLSRLAHRPGSQFDYQNVNYLLLAAIVERVSGLTWESFVRQRFLQRFAMRDTHVGWEPRALRERMAWSTGDESEAFTMADRPASWLRLGRGVVMTASDLYRWIRAIDTGAVLSAASRRKLFTVHASLGPGYGYGLGWFVRADSTGAPRVVFPRWRLRRVPQRDASLSAVRASHDRPHERRVSWTVHHGNAVERSGHGFARLAESAAVACVPRCDRRRLARRRVRVLSRRNDAGE